MADPNLLAQLLAGGPLAPMQVGGYQGAQLSDAALNPAFAHNQGPFGALAKTIAGFSGPPMLQRAAEQATAARMGANPELARMLASNDPFGMAGAQGANPVASGLLLAGQTPSSASGAPSSTPFAGLTLRPAADPLEELMKLPEAQRAAAVAAMKPADRQAALAKLRQMRTQNALKPRT